MQRKKTIPPELTPKIIKILASKQARRILELAGDKPISASDIIHASKISQPKVYHWLDRMSKVKLLQISGTINENKRKIRLYKSNVNMITINPKHKDASIMEIIGSGEEISCIRCGSRNCDLKFEANLNKMVGYCKNCEMTSNEFFLQKQREEQQKLVILQALSEKRTALEEKQIVFILEGILEKIQQSNKT